jgi:hypothetical protein
VRKLLRLNKSKGLCSLLFLTVGRWFIFEYYVREGRCKCEFSGLECDCDLGEGKRENSYVLLSIVKIKSSCRLSLV